MGNNYVEKEEFLEELIKLKESDEISEKLHLIFYNIAKNYSTIGSFRNYSYIEDMVSSAYLNCVLVARKFDIENRTNPFAYFTTIIYHNFLNFIAKEKKEQSKKWIELRNTLNNYKIKNGIEMHVTIINYLLFLLII